MPSLLIDAQPLKHINTGMGQVCVQLGIELVRQKPTDWDITFLVPKDKIGFFGSSVAYKVASEWLRHWRLGGYDVWHCLHQGSKFLPARRTKLVYTILDLNYLLLEDYSEKRKARQKRRYQLRVDQAAIITTISQYVANDVRLQLNVPTTKPLQVTYLGASVPAIDPAFRPALLPKAPFLLFVGVINPRKNVHTLLPILQASPDYRLVLAGGDNDGDYAQEIRRQAQQAGVSDRVIFTGPIDEPTKWWLYAHCAAFLFPSLFEGFGLPVIEAMAMGKPVFCSDRMSLPEVGGDKAFYFRSFEPEAMIDTFKQGMAAASADPNFPDQVREQSNLFRWADTGKTYWEIYKQVC